MKKKVLIFIGIFLLMIPFAFSLNEPTQQFNKIFLQPFYRDVMSLNTNYTYSLTVNPPDKVSSVINAIINFNGQINGQTQTFTLWVNGKSCNNPTYSVATAFSTTGNVQFSFDCSNIINKAGTYSVTLRSAVNTGAMNGWLDLTYMNNPKGDLTIHGTEYSIGQTAKLWLQLTNNSGDYVNSGVCYLDVYSPNNLKYLEHATMVNMNQNGMYYYDLPAPLIEGVYPAIASCYYVSTQTKNFAQLYFITSGVLKSGTISNTWSLDSSYLTIETNKNGGLTINNRVNATFQNFTDFYQTCNVAEALVSGITFYWNGVWNTGTAGHDIHLSVYNYSSSNWINLPNHIVGGLGGATQIVTNSISMNNVSRGLGLSSSNLLKLNVYDTNINEGAKDFKTDYLYASCDQLSSQGWQEIKGSSEMHVSLSSPLSHSYYITTLCDYSESSGCAVFKNNLSYWNYSWGYIEDVLHIVNFQQTAINSTFTYETSFGQDCTALIDITVDGASVLDNVLITAGDKENCKVTIPIDLLATQLESFITITQDNYMKWEFQRDKDLISYYALVIEPFCQEVADAQGNSFIIPLESGAESDISERYKTQPIFLSCYWALDDIYWFNYYYDESLSIGTTGDFESYLLEARYYFPEIRAEAMTVQGIIEDPLNLLYDVTTICGNHENTCATVYPPDSYFSSQEGYVVENLTIINTFNSQLDVIYTYELPIDTDCTSILEIYAVKNNTIYDTMNSTLFGIGNDDNCVLNIPLRFNDGESGEQVIIKYQNYIHWNMFQMADKVKSIRNNTEAICNQIATLNNVTYELPIASSIDGYSSDLNVMFCYRAMDDLYWWDFFYDIHEQNAPIHSVGDDEGVYSQIIYFYPFIMENDAIVTSYLASPNQRITLGLLYSIVSETHSRVWNSTNRTLTYYPPVIVDYDTVSAYVWNYTSRSLSNYTPIADAVWYWNGIINSVILNQFSVAMNQTVEDLRYPQVSIG